MPFIKLVKGLVSAGRMFAPGTILEHPNGAALIERGVAVEASEDEAAGRPIPAKKKGKKKPATQAPAV